MTHAQHATSALHADAASCEATQLQVAADLFAAFGAATGEHARTRMLTAASMREDLIVELATRIAALDAQLAASAAPAEAHCKADGGNDADMPCACPAKGKRECP